MDTRVPVTMEPRVIQSQARARVLLAGEVPGVRRRVQDTDTGAAVPRSANAKMVKYLKFSIWPGGEILNWSKYFLFLIKLWEGRDGSNAGCYTHYLTMGL